MTKLGDSLFSMLPVSVSVSISISISVSVSVSDLDSDSDMDKAHVSTLLLAGDDPNIRDCKKVERAVDDNDCGDGDGNGDDDGVERKDDLMVTTVCNVCVAVSLFLEFKCKHNLFQLKFMTTSQ